MALLVKMEREFKDMKNVKVRLSAFGCNDKIKKALDKQLNDKERLTAAKENSNLMILIESLIGWEGRSERSRYI